jgi:phosphate transport system protein
MTRELLERRMHHLQDEILVLGSMIQQSMMDAGQALRGRDVPFAQRIIARDRIINERRFVIESAALTLMATQQPMARDLRILAAILEVITELERMGDYAKGIAHIVTLLGPEPLPPALLGIFESMIAKGNAMLRRSLEAFVASDEVRARAIPAADNEVDQLYLAVYRELVAEMIADPATIDHATHLLWVAHNLERFADRVSNICERTIFTATGEMMEFGSPAYSKDGNHVT